ncbi:MAG TPA: hypothetical protein GXZ27_08850 [Thermoanaerobacterales bacterium]|nr:hypothetical protein [Thermoanaerobacterales bacterium]
MKIGIPRALFYYQFYPFWKIFFESLGHNVILSSPTNKEILKKGIELCVDDACLPIKIFHGHVADLMGKVDTIYIPRIVSIEPKEYICPKFLGLPDMIRNSIPDLPCIMDTELNLYRGKSKIFDYVFKLGKDLNVNKNRVLVAYYKALKTQKQFEYQLTRELRIPQDILNETRQIQKDQVLEKKPSHIKVLLLGHNYNIYDDFISMGLIRKLRKQNIAFITSEMVVKKNILEGTKKLSKDMFWTLGKKTIGTAHYFLDRKKIDGIIHVASFGCGPDSLVGELIEKKIKRDYTIPFLSLNLDEHAGETGFNTRLEAFLDVLEGRGYIEDNFSTYG